MSTIQTAAPTGTLRIQLTVEDALDGIRAHRRGKRSVWWASVLLAALWGTDLYFYFRQPEHRHWDFFVVLHVWVVGVSLLAACGWSLHELWPVTARSIAHRRPDLTGLCTLAFDDDTLSWNKAGQETMLGWKQVGAITETSRGLLVSHGFMDAVWFWVPERIFEANHSRAELLRIAAEHKVRINRVDLPG